MQELKANPNRTAEGVVVEAKLDRNRGPVATVLIQEGSLKPGDNIVAGATYGKVRAMFSDQGKRLKRADPAMPVEVLGLVDVPLAGDGFRAVEDERTARQTSQDAANRQQAEVFAQSRATTLEAVSSGIGAGEVKDLNIIIKTDVQGSAQPIRESLERLSTDEVKVQVLHVGTGNVTESDVLLAQASRAIIVGFNVRVEPGAQRLAEASGIDIRVYSVIYNVIEDVQKALTGMLEPKFVDIVEGHAEVRQVFKVGRTGNVAGCSVLDGRISRTSTIRVLRGGKSVFEGKLSSLRRFKDDVREVASGYECGIGLEGFNEFELGDILESVRRERAL
jgi:translation initiation factor IF-2